jgi:hypothetical protein
MAKQASRRTSQQVLMGKWWVQFLIALAFLGLAYGFISLALDSAHLWEYALGLIFVWYGVRQAVKAVRFAFFN